MIAADIGDVLLWAGVAAILVGCLGSVAFREPTDRLHYVSVAGILGLPLVAVSLAIGDPSSAAKLAFIAVLVAGTGPVVLAATGRAAGRRTDRER